MGPRAGLDRRKFSSPPGFDPEPSARSSVAIPIEIPGPPTHTHTHTHARAHTYNLLTFYQVFIIKLKKSDSLFP